MKRFLRLFCYACAGLGLLVPGIWFLSRLLGDHETLYHGKPIADWQGQLTNAVGQASNAASTVLSREIIPHLTNQMCCDTNDSRLKLALVDYLNCLPGIQVYCARCDGRRVMAINYVAFIGPRAKGAAPALLALLAQKDDVLCGPAASALVKIQADPDKVIPALTNCLVDSRGHGQPDVVEALGELGSKAQAAVPMLLKLLADRSSKEIIRAVPRALKEIDPEAASRAGVK